MENAWPAIRFQIINYGRPSRFSITLSFLFLVASAPPKRKEAIEKPNINGKVNDLVPGIARAPSFTFHHLLFGIFYLIASTIMGSPSGTSLLFLNLKKIETRGNSSDGIFHDGPPQGGGRDRRSVFLLLIDDRN